VSDITTNSKRNVIKDKAFASLSLISCRENMH